MTAVRPQPKGWSDLDIFERFMMILLSGLGASGMLLSVGFLLLMFEASGCRS